MDKNETGFALIVIVIFLGILSGLYLDLMKLWTQDSDRYKLLLARVRQQSEAAEQIKDYIYSAQSRGVWSLPPLFWTNNINPSEHVFSQACLLKKKLRIGRSHLPSWKLISNNSQHISCSSRVAHLVSGESLRGTHTCSQLRRISPASSMVKGNLTTDSLVIEPRGGESKILFAVAGEAVIRELHLRQFPPGASLTLVSLGNLEIGKIMFEGRRPQEIRISSSTGKVLLTESPAELSWCDSTPSRPPFAHAESALGVLIAGRPVSSFSWGCNLSRDSATWPELMLIGGPA